MGQCKRCRYSFYARDELRCGKRMMQRCRQDGSVQRLEMVPGLCSVLNTADDCSVFRPKLFNWLKDLLNRL